MPNTKPKDQPTLYKSGNEYVQTSAALELVDRPAPGVYTLDVEENSIKLVRNTEYHYTPPDTLYGDVREKSDMVINRWVHNKKNTGVILSGDQGTGKTLTSRLIIKDAVEVHGAVVIEMIQPLIKKEVFEFINKLSCPLVIFVDEFEKKYKWNLQEQLLGYMDGGSLEGVLWLLTVNNMREVQSHMLHRPSRVYYHYQFQDVSMDAVKCMIDDLFDVVAYKKHNNLKTSAAAIKKEVAQTISTFSIRTYDTILAFINDINRTMNTPEKVLTYLNVVLHERSKSIPPIYYRLYIENADKTKEDVTKSYDTDEIDSFVGVWDIFGDGSSGGRRPMNEYTKISLCPFNSALPAERGFAFSKKTWIPDDTNFDILKYKIGETPAKSPVILEFSKVPYPPLPPEEKAEPAIQPKVEDPFAGIPPLKRPRSPLTDFGMMN